ncbi:shikimate dehydrogenase [Cohaesibacter haloalkalitolerans]|uniref:shikimate dehydrogenase n=1 Tax=Cohaesibacter haloalkalitolerans TaxID=1162980 RepID=UPI001FE02B2B|nr:shikimate dehydrogenase [Cohaesibacter haloalkalitolerans]
MMQGKHTAVIPERVNIGLIGCGIGKSRTPAMHMAEAKAQGFDCDYSLLDMDDESRAGLSLANMLDLVEKAGFAGVNVTYPYKMKVISHLDELSDNARMVGAVNTVVFRDGKRIGHNTDLWGFSESFRRGLVGANWDDVLLIGAGGAGVAVAHALVQCGVKTLSIHDMDLGRADDLVDHLKRTWPDMNAHAVASLDGLFSSKRPDGVVNATPMGMAKLPGSAMPVDYLNDQMWVADIVYFPLETQLLKDARACGCRTLPGSGMAVFQAVRAFELFTGLPADPARMKETFDTFDLIPSN